MTDPKTSKSPKAQKPATDSANSSTAPGDEPVRKPDRFFTWILLVFAVYSVFTGLGDYMNPRATMNEIYTQLNATLPGLNLGTFTNIDFAIRIGWVSVTVEAIVLGLTFYFAIKRMRAGKWSWWVPVAGAAISAIAVSILLGIALATDAGFVDAFQAFWANRK